MISSLEGILWNSLAASALSAEFLPWAVPGHWAFYCFERDWVHLENPRCQEVDPLALNLCTGCVIIRAQTCWNNVVGWQKQGMDIQYIQREITSLVRNVWLERRKLSIYAILVAAFFPELRKFLISVCDLGITVDNEVDVGSLENRELSWGWGRTRTDR